MAWFTAVQREWIEPLAKGVGGGAVEWRKPGTDVWYFGSVEDWAVTTATNQFGWELIKVGISMRCPAFVDSRLVVEVGPDDIRAVVG